MSASLIVSKTESLMIVAAAVALNFRVLAGKERPPKIVFRHLNG